jgi:hypothetical protein
MYAIPERQTTPPVANQHPFKVQQYPADHPPFSLRSKQWLPLYRDTHVPAQPPQLLASSMAGLPESYRHYIICYCGGIQSSGRHGQDFLRRFGRGLSVGGRCLHGSTTSQLGMSA